MKFIAVKDPNYVPVDEVSTVSKSKLAVKKGSVTDKFNKLHAKQFQKYVYLGHLYMYVSNCTCTLYEVKVENDRQNISLH